MSNVVIDIVTQFTGKKAFKEADSAAAKLSNSVKKLGAAFGVSLGGAAVLRFAKNSAKAFIEDEKAASRLTQSVKNLGLAYAVDDIRKYVDQLTLATGVADSELRPALQALLQVTGSVTKSQQLLSDAISISRGSGENLTTVANDLSQAYVGNLKGLRKYNLGLTQAELKASSFVDIQERLNSLFKGASAAYLKTYAGQMELLTNNANEAKEVIGKSLVDAVAALGKDDSVANLATDMQNAAKYTADVVTGISAIIDEVLMKVPQGGLLQKLWGTLPLPTQALLKGVFGVTDILAGAGQSATAKKGTFNFKVGGGLGTGSTAKIDAAQAKKAELAAKKRDDARLKSEKAIAKATADALKIKKAGTLFDIEQAGIIAALQGQISAQDETRLKLQFAILTGNVTQATQLAGEVARAQGLTKSLVDYYSGIPNAKNPFEGWIKTLTDAEAIAKRIAEENAKQPPNPLVIVPPPAIPSTGSGGVNGDLMPSNPSKKDPFFYGGVSSPNVNVVVTLDGQEMAGAVTKVQTNGYLSGKIIALERTLGSFG